MWNWLKRLTGRAEDEGPAIHTRTVNGREEFCVRSKRGKVPIHEGNAQDGAGFHGGQPDWPDWPPAPGDGVLTSFRQAYLTEFPKDELRRAGSNPAPTRKKPNLNTEWFGMDPAIGGGSPGDAGPGPAYVGIDLAEPGAERTAVFPERRKQGRLALPEDEEEDAKMAIVGAALEELVVVSGPVDVGAGWPQEEDCQAPDAEPGPKGSR